jgi:hypothetical protein
MIELGRNNMFLTFKRGSGLAISSTLDFLELIGTNFVYFHRDPKSTIGVKCRKVKFQDNTDLCNKVFENLFRCDVLVFESNFIPIPDIRKITTLPIIVIACDSVLSKFEKMDKIYDFWLSDSLIKGGILGLEDRDTLYMITDVGEDTTSSIYDLKKRWIRDKKIDDLFDNSSRI